MQKTSLLALVTFSSLVLSACSNRIPQQPQREVDISEDQSLTIGTPTPNTQTEGEQNVLGDSTLNFTPQKYDPAQITELQYQELKEGTGATVQQGDTVVVHYTGQLPDGTVFDSSLPRRQPFVFEVGAGQVIQGWDQGLLGMKEGGQRRLLIPASLAYGPNGIPGAIPPNSPLIFEVELLKVQRPQQGGSLEAQPQAEEAAPADQQPTE